MDNFTQQDELLVRYLDGDMNQEERAEFESKLLTDEGARRRLEDLQTARAAVKLYGLRDRVASVHKEMMVEMRPEAALRKMGRVRAIARYGLRIAASVAFIAICFFAYNFFSVSPGKLYNEKYSSFELSSLRGDNGTEASGVEEAYRQRNYQQVVALSEKSTEISIKDEFLEAVSYLELDKHTSAIDHFSRVIARDRVSDHPVYNDEAEYYLALCYLKTRNYEKALELMNTIHNNPSHLYHEKFTKGFILKVKMLKWR